MKTKKVATIMLSLMAVGMAVALIGCNFNVGVFLDSPVAGLDYTNGKCRATTQKNGTFVYNDNQILTFSIGDLVLGSSVGKATISPLDIVPGATDVADQRVNNICVLLQSLDKDADLNNGIQISPPIRRIVSGYAERIGFDQAVAAFAADPNVQALMADLNAAGVFSDTDPRPRRLRNAEDAREHLQRSLSARKVVRTRSGALRGFAPDAATWAFYGIPYARPPIGELRWRPPVPAKAWQGVRDAVGWSDQAAQNPMYESFGEGGMSEDCLYLNVIAPKGDKKRPLPVMVWFHGGGFRILTGNAKSFNNTALPQKGVVVVTVNHRLGPFGYLAHPALSAESKRGVSGNYGQLDLIAALKWVRDNIAAFGGDPRNVTIFGESGGGGKVLSLLSSPLAKGLFHKAICQSGMAAPSDEVINPMNSLAAAEEKGEAIAARLGVEGEQDVLAAMRAMPWTQIIAALDAAPAFEYSPNVDGRWYMPDTMENTFAAGRQNDVPLIAGANTGDMPGLIEGFIYDMPWMAQDNQSEVFAYVFSHVPANWKNQGVLAYHGIELVYSFNYYGSFLSHYLLGLTGLDEDPAAAGLQTTLGGYLRNPPGVDATDALVSDRMMRMWAAFAATGDPSIEEAQWPAYTAENDTYMNIGASLVVESGIAEAFPGYPSAD